MGQARRLICRIPGQTNLFKKNLLLANNNVPENKLAETIFLWLIKNIKTIYLIAGYLLWL
jgi:hypothetical protein